MWKASMAVAATNEEPVIVEELSGPKEDRAFGRWSTTRSGHSTRDQGFADSGRQTRAAR